MHLQIIILSIGWSRQIQTWPKQTKPNPGIVAGRAQCVLKWGFYVDIINETRFAELKFEVIIEL